jgi:4'-phosphopantetheinyl transferase
MARVAQLAGRLRSRFSGSPHPGRAKPVRALSFSRRPPALSRRARPAQDYPRPLLTCDYGKPYLVSPSAPRTLAFNLSHAHGLLLVAVTYDRRIGIDVEYTRPPLPDVEHIAERFFSVEEKEALRALSSTARNEAFFRCWTCKEAYLKARGLGLSMPLDRFQVAVIPGQPARLLHVEGDLEEASRWSLRELVPAPGYVATLAVEGGGWRLSCWRYPCSLQGKTQALAETGSSAPLRTAYPA